MKYHAQLSYWQARKRLLHLPGVGYYILSCLLATCGGGLSYIAITWQLSQLPHALRMVAFAQMLFWVPSIVLCPFIGVWIDRYDRKRMYVGLNFFRAFLFIGLGIVLTFKMSFYLCFILMLLNGASFPFYPPVTASLIREMVSSEWLLYANSTVDTAYEVGNIVGMGLLSAAMLSLGSPADAVVVAGIFLLAGGLFSLLIKRPQREQRAAEDETPPHFWNDFKVGCKFIASNGPVSLIYSIQALMMVTWMVTPALLAPFAKSILHASGSQFGWLETCISVGLIIGACIMPLFKKRFGFVAVCMACMVLVSVSVLGFGINRQLWLGLVFNLFIGIGLSLWALVLTEAQLLTPLALQGRVQAMFGFITSVGIALLYGLMQLTANWFPVEALYQIQAYLFFICIILLWVYQHKRKASSPT